MNKPNKRIQQSEKTRQKLLDISLKLFVLKGYEGTTVRNIAAEATISPGLIFHYFPSKQAILEAHIETLNLGVRHMAQQLNTTDQPSLAVLRDVAEIMFASFAKDTTRHLFLLAQHIAVSAAVPTAARQLLNQTQSFEATVRLIERGQQTGEIVSGDPRTLALIYWGALQGVAQLLVALPNESPPSAGQLLSFLNPRNADSQSSFS